MTKRRSPVHEPPPDPVVHALVDAGVSKDTALAMEGWKAEEVLELLQNPGQLVDPQGAASDPQEPVLAPSA